MDAPFILSPTSSSPPPTLRRLCSTPTLSRFPAAATACITASRSTKQRRSISTARPRPRSAHLSLTSATATTGIPGTSFSFALTGSNTPNYFTIASGTLPAGLSLNPATGVISGTPTAIGSTTITVKAANSYAASAPQTVTIAVNAASRLSNLSVRARSGAGGEILIAGFTVSGSGTKPLLVRGVGPGLIPFGLPHGPRRFKIGNLTPGPPSPPKTTIGAPKPGRSAPPPSKPRRPVSAPSPLRPGAKTLRCSPRLASGGYTVQVSGVANTTGVALVEVYDADAAVLSASARLSNVSARTQVGTGADILVAGFTLTGTGTQTILNPCGRPHALSLQCPGVLADPILEVYSGSTRIASNDNWGTQTGGVTVSSIVTAAGAVGAFPLAANTKDSVSPP